MEALPRRGLTRDKDPLLGKEPERDPVVFRGNDVVKSGVLRLREHEYPFGRDLRGPTDMSARKILMWSFDTEQPTLRVAMTPSP